jgi:hypothetical protein
VFFSHCTLGAIGRHIFPATPPVETVRQSLGRAESSTSVRHVEDLSRQSEATYYAMIIRHEAKESYGAFHQVKDIVGLVIFKE